MGWMVCGSNPGGGEFSPPVQTGPGAHPTSCTMGGVSLTCFTRSKVASAWH